MGCNKDWACGTNLYLAHFLCLIDFRGGGRFYSVLIDSSEAEQNAPPPSREPTWLAQIAEINHEVEIELDDALAKLRETAREFGIATTRQEERAKTAPPLSQTSTAMSNGNTII
jgi:hypothetical protein